jgi:hypothetical protein
MESSPIAGNTFTNVHKDWKEGMYENFKDWSVGQFGLREMESGDEAEVPVNFRKAKEIIFEKNRRGEFILPPMENYKKIKEKQRVIRGYVGAVYRESVLGSSFFFLPLTWKFRRIHQNPEGCIPLLSSRQRRPNDIFARLCP